MEIQYHDLDPPLTMEKPDEEDEKTADWIFTYSDLVTLLLCFFILLFAVSETDSSKLKAIDGE